MRTMLRDVFRFLAAVAATAALGCGDAEPPRPRAVGTARQPLEAYCSADVNGIGPVDVETDYLPHVIACENGAASYEALRAQAIAARSYLYYKLETSGSIGDGTGDQVYSCGNQPGPEHQQAVASTSGVFLSYMGVTVCAFYVAGALQDGPACVGGQNDPTGTEHWVTYNQGLSGDAVIQTQLGFVDPSNYRNRGCKSQNGAHCLSDAGWIGEDIVRFYYGEDIGIETATGPCVTPPDPSTGVGGTGAGAGGGAGVTVGAGGAGASGGANDSLALEGSAEGDVDSGCGCRAAGEPEGSFAAWAIAALATIAVTGASRRRCTGRAASR